MSHAIAAMWREVEVKGQPGVVSDEVALDWRMPMVWTDTSERGKKVIAQVKEYQDKCKESVAEKVTGLTDHLDQNEKKDGAMVVVVGKDTSAGAALPGLKAAIELPDDELYLQEEGGSAWVTSSRPWKYRIGPGVLPLPGFGQLVQCRGPAGAALLLIPVQKLVDEGVVFLNEVRGILRQPEGGKLLANWGKLVVWEAVSSAIAWAPYGWLPMMIAPDEKHYSHLWFLPVFSKLMCCDVPLTAWTPIVKLNLDVLQKHSGQPIWKAWLDTTQKLVDLRAGQ